MAESDIDRNENATPYKLQKARERGQVAKSPDFAATLVFAAAMLYLTWQGWTVWREQFLLDRAILTQVGRLDGSGATLWPLMEKILNASLMMAMPFFATLMITAVVGNLIQSGPAFSMDPIKIDWKRINPVEGFKRIFSIRTLYMGLRTLLKLGLLIPVAYISLKNLLPQFFSVAGMSAMGMIRALISDFASVGMYLAAMLGLLALIDLGYAKREFAKKMRMSRQDIKDENKHREGDPRIRSRLRQLRREMLKRSLALRNAHNADVVITNPTHLAIALRYAHGEMRSPQMIAKGQGFMAAAIRQIATRHNIAIVQNPPLARTLYRELAIDDHVPTHLYGPVARIIVWVFARRESSRAAAQKTVPVTELSVASFPPGNSIPGSAV